MKALIRTIAYTSALMAFAGLVTAQTPKILISTNQMNATEARNASRLHADGTWFLSYNSPDVNLGLWRYACARIGTGIFATEDGAITQNYLLEETMTPTVMLRDAAGRYVSAPGGAGRALVANVSPDLRTGLETFHYFWAPPSTPVPRTPALTELLIGPSEINFQSYGRKFVEAANGGGGFLVPTHDQPSWWERFRLFKLSGGDQYIRQNDKVALQTWGGIFNGGMFVTSDQTRGGTLVANGPSAGTWQQFSVEYPCAFVVGSQVAPVTHAMAYMEFSGLPVGNGQYARQWTLEPAAIDAIAARTRSRRVVVLGRAYDDISEYPGQLPTHKQQILSALADANCRGVVWEMAAGGSIRNSNIHNGIDAVCSRGKACFLLLPPRGNSTDYTADVARTVKSLKAYSRWYGQVNIVLACYARQSTGVGFLGGRNSVEGALNWIKANR